MRNHHHLNESGIFDSVHIHSEINKRDNQSEIDFFAQRSDNKISTFGWIQHGNVYQDKIIYKNVFYPWEATRGYPANEDLISPLCIEFDLKVNESNYLLFSDKEIIDAITIIDQVEKKYKKLPVIQEIPIKRKRTDISDGILEKLDYDDKQMFNYEDYMKLLEFSMRDFVANNDIIAGFPWFGCWGRDTMISLEGVLNLPKGDLLAYDILLKYANQIQNGLIPNMCSESFQQANYNSIDATLWFIIRLYQVCKSIETNHVQAKKDKLVRWKYAKKIVENIFECLLENNHPDFFIRYDGLLELREHFSSATWMDAKINNYAVTPRDGCPVEINALLFNAVCCYEKIIESHNALSTESDNFLTSQSFLEVSSRIKESFIKYWVGDFLADRLMGETPICEIRPNAIIAMSLPFSNRLLSQDKIQQLYETAFYELYTPYGLRTLSTRDYKFQKKYSGTLEERDYAYHNGTVWAWLLLPLVHTWFNAFPKKPFDETVQHITYVIDKLRNGYMYGHIASVAEVFDGDKPHFPKGCPAQAWSVSALFSIENILANFIKEKKL
jgi:predicted glycogen debranching enzyme